MTSRVSHKISTAVFGLERYGSHPKNSKIMYVYVFVCVCVCVCVRARVYVSERSSLYIPR